MDGELFIHDLLGESFAIDYAQEADRWEQLLEEALKDKFPGIIGHSNTAVQASADFAYQHREIKLTGANNLDVDTPSLKIVPVNMGADDPTTGLYVFLAARRPITETDINVWLEAVNKARSRLSEPHPEFEWAAALGQAHDITNKRHALKKQAKAGALTLRSGHTQHITYFNIMPNFGGTGFSVSWPVVIEGKSKGYNWLVASREAGKDVHKMAALLSLAWGSTWQLIHAAQQTAPGALKVPKSIGMMHVPPRNIPMPKSYQALPKWVDKAFAAIDTSPILNNALNAYYQGLLMEREHPSFALVAFVGAIEAVGRHTLGDKCPCCGKPHGAKQKFKAGLATVISDKAEVSRLSETYAERSDTAHEGKLHGNETLLGSLPAPSIFSPDAADFFAYTDLLKIKGAARRSLIKAIKGIR